MKPASLIFGCILLACACWLGWRSERLDERLRDQEIAPVRANSWPRQSLRAYRTAGWPLLIQLRHRVTAIYAIAIAGGLLVMYGFSALYR